MVDCEFADEFAENCPKALCVLVYREYNSSPLTVMNYTFTTVFPVTVTVDQPENFTFVIFETNCEGIIEEWPTVKLKPNITVTNPSGKYTCTCTIMC